MSDSEKMGRCFNEVYERRGSPSELKIADAIDRLAADVAAVKAKVDAVSPEDVRHFVESEKAWVKLVEEQRDAAIRGRDEARAEVERLKAIVHSDAGHMAKILIENERLRAAPAAPQPAGQGISPKVADTQPTGNAAPAAGWLTDEERHILGAHLQSLREQRRAMERGGQTLGYSANPCAIKREADVIDALLARAGLPPVVGVPPFENYAPEVLHLRYRDAISRAGIQWKEVGRE